MAFILSHGDVSPGINFQQHTDGADFRNASLRFLHYVSIFLDNRGEGQDEGEEGACVSFWEHCSVSLCGDTWRTRDLSMQALGLT